MKYHKGVHVSSHHIGNHTSHDASNHTRELFSFCESEYVKAANRAASIACRIYGEKILQVARGICAHSSEFSETVASELQPATKDQFLKLLRSKLSYHNPNLLTCSGLMTAMKDFFAFRYYDGEGSTIPFFRENEESIPGYKIMLHVALTGRAVAEGRDSVSLGKFYEGLAKYRRHEKKSGNKMARILQNPFFVLLCDSLLGHKECTRLLDEIEETLIYNEFPSINNIDWIRGRVKHEQENEKKKKNTGEECTRTYFPRTSDGATFNLLAFAGEFNGREECEELRRRLESDARALKEKESIKDLQRKVNEQTPHEHTDQFRNLFYKACGRNIVGELGSIETHEEAYSLIEEACQLLRGHSRSYSIVREHLVDIRNHLMETWENRKSLRDVEKRSRENAARLHRLLPSREYTFVAVRDRDGKILGYEHSDKLVKDNSGKPVHCEHVDDLLKISEEKSRLRNSLPSKIEIENENERDGSKITHYFT